MQELNHDSKQTEIFLQIDFIYMSNRISAWAIWDLVTKLNQDKP